LNKETIVASAVIAVLAMLCLVLVAINNSDQARKKAEKSPAKLVVPDTNRLIATVVPESVTEAKSPFPTKKRTAFAVFAPAYANETLADTIEGPSLNSASASDLEPHGSEFESVESVELQAENELPTPSGVDFPPEVSSSNSRSVEPELEPETNSEQAETSTENYPESQQAIETLSSDGWRPVTNPLHWETTKQASPLSMTEEATPHQSSPIAKVDPHTTVSSPASDIDQMPTNQEPATHTVAVGETLLDISQKHLGATHRWPEIYRLNRDVLANDIYSLRSGISLKLPAKDLWRASGTRPQPEARR
jgi:nucleoid-associated protein YgaU